MQENQDLRTLATFLRRLQWALAALATCWLLWLLSPIMTPFVLAALLGLVGVWGVVQFNASYWLCLL